jgi:hypothetical protein
VSTDEPMSADRRVLAIAAVTMVVLVLVGVVSAQVFSAAPCRGLAPEDGPRRAAGTDADAITAAALPDLDEQDRQALLNALRTLSVGLGAPVGFADVRGAARLVDVPEGFVATGDTTTLVEGTGTEVGATAASDGGQLVGSGGTLYSLALVNELTGQVDAFVPVGADLEPGSCVDTATVGTPLAFHLDAGGGELLLLRIDDDGDDPLLELRDGQRGRVWAAELELAAGPAGVVAERVGGSLGSDLVVVASRVTPEHDDLPAVAGYDRRDGTARWELAGADLIEHAPPGDGAVWVDVLGVSPDIVVAALTREELEDQAALVGIDPSRGSVRWVSPPDRPGRPIAVTVGEDGVATLLHAGGGTVTASALGLDDGDRTLLVEAAASTGRLAAVDDAAVVVADGSVTVVADGRAHTVTTTGVRAADVLATDDAAVILLVSDDGALAVTFAR